MNPKWIIHHLNMTVHTEKVNLEDLVVRFIFIIALLTITICQFTAVFPKLLLHFWFEFRICFAMSSMFQELSNRLYWLVDWYKNTKKLDGLSGDFSVDIYIPLEISWNNFGDPLATLSRGPKQKPEGGKSKNLFHCILCCKEGIINIFVNMCNLCVSL